MDLREIKNSQKLQYNKFATHVIQSFQWGEFRKSLDLPVLRYGLYENGDCINTFQLTVHRIPFTNTSVGYLPKGSLPNKQFANALKEIAKIHNLAFIKIEPNIEIENGQLKIDSSFIKSPKPLFTKNNFILDISKSEEDILKNMHPKTRYNIKVAQKHGVKIEERTDDEALQIYLKLYFETTKRQGYYGHNEKYHRQVWEILRQNNMTRLLIAFYKNKPLSAWMLLNFKDTLYYPYGGSSKLNPEVMANNLIAWEAIKLGKKLRLKNFDMWGALGPKADSKDPWFGFHRFKAGYGGKLVEYIGTYDLVLNWPIYIFFNIIDQLTPIKIFLLKIISK